MSKNELGLSDNVLALTTSCGDLDQLLTASAPRSQVLPSMDDSTLINHPIFSLKQDDLLSSLLNLARPILQASQDPSHENSSHGGWEWLEQLLEVIFGATGIRELCNNFKKLGITYNHSCGRLISMNEVFFRCLDCDQSQRTGLPITVGLCADCFDKSNHKDHRIIIMKNTQNPSLACSCGSSSLLGPQGSCSKHVRSNGTSVKDILAKFPAGLLGNFEKNLKKAFYNVFVLFEISERAQSQQSKESILAIAQLAMEELLLFCNICYGEVSPAFVLALGNLFRSPLLTGYDSLWHNCEDLTKEDSNDDIEVFETHKCSCTILSLLFRFAGNFDQELQMKLHKILVECSKEESFKIFLCEEFTQNIQFLFNPTYTDGQLQNCSYLLSLKSQLYTTDELCGSVLLSGRFSNLTNLLKRTAHNLDQFTHEVFTTLHNLLSIIDLVLKRRRSTSKVTNFELNLLDDLLETVHLLQPNIIYKRPITFGTHAHQVDYNELTWSIKLESMAISSITHIFELLNTLPDNERTVLNSRFLKLWHSCFSYNAQSARNKVIGRLPAFNIALEHSLIPALLQSSSSSDYSLLFKSLASTPSLTEPVLEGIVKRLGTIRYLHLAHDYNNAAGLESYYGLNSLTFERDIVGIQILGAAVEKTDLFSVLARGFFSNDKELQAFFSGDVKTVAADDYVRTKVTLMEDFLHMLVYIMNDEICALNVALSSDSVVQEDIIKSFGEVFEKVITNALLGQYWVDLTALKHTLLRVLKDSSYVDLFLEKLAVLDQSTKKIRVKDQLKDELDPYLFYRMPAFQREITHAVASKIGEKDKKPDLVSGKHYTNLPSHLSNVQKNLYEGSLPEFLSSFVVNAGEEVTVLSRLVLKLILTHLYLVHEVSQDSLIVAKAAANYLSKSFLESLRALSNKKDLGDCTLCVEKILSLLESLAIKLGRSDIYALITENSEKQEETLSKKDLAAKKMLKLKEEFMKKQLQFANKNSQLIEENNATATKPAETCEKQELVCQHCLEHIDQETDTYGIPLHMSFTNNFFDMNQEHKWTRDEEPENLRMDWWPVLSSCHHYYHHKCFNALYINSRVPTDPPQNMFADEFETCCSLCKTLCNSFLPLNKANAEAEQGSSNNEQERKQFPQLYMSFSERILKQIKNLKRRLASSPHSAAAKNNTISVEEVVARAYNYFIESFYSQEDSKFQTKTFILYQKFFSMFLGSLHKTPGGKPKFFERLYVESLTRSGSKPEEKAIYLLSCRSEEFINELSFQSLIWCSNKDCSQEEVVKDQLELVKEYLTFKLIQVYAFEGQSKNKSLAKLVSCPQKTVEGTLERVAYPIHKAILATTLNNCILFDASSPAVFCSTDDTLASVNKGLQTLLGDEYSFARLVQEALSDLKSKSPAVTGLLQTMFTDTLQYYSLSIPKTAKYLPRMIRLPETYAEFNSTFFRKKCSRCNQHSKHMATSICLLCGKIICQACCHSSDSDRNYGNLNNHARKYHMGAALFIERHSLTKTIISAPVNATYPGEEVYVDEYKQPVQFTMRADKASIYSLDFGKFKLNEGFKQYIRSQVNGQSIVREAFKVGRICGYYYNDNIL